MISVEWSFYLVDWCATLRVRVGSFGWRVHVVHNSQGKSWQGYLVGVCDIRSWGYDTSLT
jgi:hypothetical protein